MEGTEGCGFRRQLGTPNSSDEIENAPSQITDLIRDVTEEGGACWFAVVVERDERRLPASTSATGCTRQAEKIIECGRDELDDDAESIITDAR